MLLKKAIVVTAIGGLIPLFIAACGSSGAQPLPQPEAQTVELTATPLPPLGELSAPAVITDLVASPHEAGQSDALDLPAESPPAQEPTAEPAQPLAAAAVRGVVWQDICSLAEDEAAQEGCLAAEDGMSYRADGVFNPNEPWIAGVQVTLRRGYCPGNGADTVVTTTGPDGGYLFSDLAPGSYCIFIDPTIEPNATLLRAGGWTYPGPGTGSVAITLAAAEIVTADFGWEFRPEQKPVSTETGCLDQAAYVADVSIPDGTVLAPAEAFVKTWRVRNEGSCPWTPSYALIFAGGEQMGGPLSVSLPQTVEPGAEVDLSVSLVSPGAEGAYRGDWLVQNEQGETFGSRGIYPFYVQIVVAGSVETTASTAANSGSAASTGAAITGLVWQDHCGLLAHGSPAAGCISNGAGGYRPDGLFNNGEPPIAGVQVKLSPGDCPGAEDVYTTATTDPNGLYRFSGLQAGPHCISIDTALEANQALLMPGIWTYPGPNTGSATVVVEPDRLHTADFGWSFFPASR